MKNKTLESRRLHKQWKATQKWFYGQKNLHPFFVTGMAVMIACLIFFMPSPLRDTRPSQFLSSMLISLVTLQVLGRGKGRWRPSPSAPISRPAFFRHDHQQVAGADLPRNCHLLARSCLRPRTTIRRPLQSWRPPQNNHIDHPPPSTQPTPCPVNDAQCRLH